MAVDETVDILRADAMEQVMYPPSDSDEERYRHVCQGCGAAGYGNATCRDCVAQWSRFGISQASVNRLLAAIGDKPPERPFGTPVH